MLFSSSVNSQKIEDRGGDGTDAMKAHLGEATMDMDIRQTRRGWLQELCLGCQARTEFKYFVNEQQVAHSLEESNCCCRYLCAGVHPFTMSVEEVHTRANLLTVERPLRCHVASFKCCCYQQGIVTSGTGSQRQYLGSVRETWYICVPEFYIFDQHGNGLYRLHPPTCCCGFCVNICAEGNPCCWGRGGGCCKVPFHLFPHHQINTDAAYHVGKIVKKPKSLLSELFTNANAFDIVFPPDATPQQKAVIVGAAILLNALFFEEKFHEREVEEEASFFNFGMGAFNNQSGLWEY